MAVVSAMTVTIAGQAPPKPAAAAKAAPQPMAKESGGPKGPEPTRYGDWENKGIASDF